MRVEWGKLFYSGYVDITGTGMRQGQRKRCNDNSLKRFANENCLFTPPYEPWCYFSTGTKESNEVRLSDARPSAGHYVSGDSSLPFCVDSRTTSSG